MWRNDFKTFGNRSATITIGVGGFMFNSSSPSRISAVHYAAPFTGTTTQVLVHRAAVALSRWLRRTARPGHVSVCLCMALCPVRLLGRMVESGARLSCSALRRPQSTRADRRLRRRSRQTSSSTCEGSAEKKSVRERRINATKKGDGGVSAARAGACWRFLCVSPTFSLT